MNDPVDHELQRHAGGLRALARDLLRDAHAAEDVVQATCARALARRDLAPGPLGGWLQRTARNFARQWRRGERRRIAREAAVPPPDPAPAVADQLARRETLQAVTAAVLHLDEPYQTTVFLRYFEDLPPRASARRTGANVKTVKSRLARGLALLRVRLDHLQRSSDSERGWRAALAATFGLPRLAPLLPLPTGTLIVSTTTKASLVAVACCAGGLLVWQLRDDPAPSPAAPSAATPSIPAGAASTVLDAPEDAGERTSVLAAAPAPVPWLDHPYEVALDVLVVDPLGMPVEGHTLQLAPIGCSDNAAERATGPDGRVALAWRTRQRTIDVQVADPRGQVRRVTLQHGRRTQLVLLARGKETSRATFRLTLSPRMRLRDADQVLGSFLHANVKEASNATMRAGLHPHARFGDARADVPSEAAGGPQLGAMQGELVLDFSDLVVHQRKLATSLQSLHFDGGKLRFDGGKLGFVDAKATAAGGIVDGIVFGADGAPAAQVPVHLLGAGPQPLHRAATDDQGCFRFANVLPGELRVRAGGDHRGLGSTTVLVADGPSPCTVNLHRGACVRGRAIDGTGRPRAEHVIEWRALDGSWADATTTDEHGAFVLANLPAGPASVFLFDRSGNTSIPIAGVPSVLPDTGEIVLAATGAGSVLRLEPASGEDAAPRSVRLWHADTGLACTVRPPEDGRVWTSPPLPAGFYDVELRAPAAGVVALGRHWLDGEHDFDLGRVDAAAGGSVRVAIPRAALPAAAEQQACEIYALRGDLDVRVELAPVPLDRTIRLPAGGYVLAWRHADGGVRFHRFAVEPARETLVSPAP